MKERFSALEVMEMAKDIEKRGKKFYLKHAEATENRDLRELFKKLAQDEQDHYEKFVALTEELREDKKDADYLYEEDVSAYFNYLVEYSVFPKDDSEESIEALNDVERALKLAIQAEKDSILFYREMCEFNEGKTIEAVNKLIEEEKDHLRALGKYIKEYGQK
ncbi:ferritin-like domain-containing protein [Halanaerobium kushneri]|jgi:rubrerythrin|uniref:Rubrerythrin n=1 Tax=Halanaerobium kushneri TaxID=56779 RepID=A0A1N6VTJ7_9FIRM|nr:ferritin family protein [Halanaerobium kushneri]SIQ80976.1 Rubrerythrin [Halanaerobium kushneri]